MSLSLLTRNQKMLTPEEETALLQEWTEKGDEATMLRLIRAFSPIVSKYVRKYSAYGISKEDLTSVGNLALIETVKRFEPAKNCKFSTYSSQWVRGTMLIFIASNYFAFTLKSQKMKHVFFKLRRLMHEQQQNKSETDLHEMMEKLSDHFGLSPTRLEEIYDLIQHPHTSVQQPAFSRGEQTAVEFGDLIPTEDPDPETSLIDSRMAAFRRSILMTTMQEVLNDRERTIITGRMLAESEEARMTLQDLADQFNLSRERVRQISNTALAKLERAIREKCTDMEPRSLFSS